MSDAENRRLLLDRLIRRSEPLTAPALPQSASRTEPASYAQRRLWFVDQLQEVHTPYTLHAVQRLAFAVDCTLLERSINAIVKRHEALRTTFALRGEELEQNIHPELHIPLRTIDLADLPEAHRTSEALRQVGALIGRRFDLERGPLLRTELYRLSGRDFMFLLTVHHIVFDWQSFQVFFRELEAIYGAAFSGRPHALTNTHSQYASFAREQRKRLTPERVREEVAFWQAELAGLSMLNLPLDRSRSVKPSFRGGQRQLELPASLVEQLQQRAVGTQATLFTILLAGLWAALGRLCGQDDFAVGLPVTGRDTSASQEAIGFYVDTLVTRARWNEDPTGNELVGAARAALRRSMAHRALPFELLVQHLHPTRDLGVNPLFQVGFQLMQYTMTHVDSHGTDPARSGAMFDLCIDLWPQGKEIHGRVQYSADLFDPPTVDLVIHAFVQALFWLVQDDRRLSELSLSVGLDASHDSVLQGERLALQGRSCLELIAEVARNQPELPALEGYGRVLSYRELLQNVDRLAAAISAQGILPGSIVVIELERSPELICLQLALMRCRVAFSCVDPVWPVERRRGIAAEAGAALIIDARQVRLLQEARNDSAVLKPPERNDAAYVIFTSGSTGHPKGVVIEHCGLLNVALEQKRIFRLGAGRRVAQLSSPTFDASIFETVLALCSGATLVVAPPGILAAEVLERFIEQSAIDTIVVPPSVLATTRAEACHNLKLICVAGENCPADLAERFGANQEFWNLYGPTETTIWATSGHTPVGAKISIGRPIANLKTVVVDSSMRIVPVGMVGELCVAGVGLARGYLGRDSLTAERFVERIGGLHERFYRTGDLVRQNRAGELLFLGRADRQVKVRGLRIEPEEVEIVLRAHRDVSDVVVAAVPIGGEPTLVAYLQARVDNEESLVNDCRRRVRERLPAYLCPSRYIVLKAFTRSASGKVDVKVLPEPADLCAPGRTYIEPATATQRQVANLMQQVLHISRVGASDNFFEIGGHSLAAAQLASRLRVVFKAELTIGDVFAHSIVSELASHIDTLLANPAEEAEEVPLVRLSREQSALTSQLRRGAR